MCLEAMTGHAVNEGAIFYATSKRRRVVPITPQLRVQVEQTARAIRQMFATAALPPPCWTPSKRPSVARPAR
jgi:CRISPR-associated exonuclease Cas4